MAHISHTSYRILGSLEYTLPFWETLSHLDFTNGCIGLRSVAEAFGIPVQDAAVHGNIWSCNFFPDDKAGLGEIHLETETESEAPHDLLSAVCCKFGGRLSVSYLTVNCKKGEFAIHDEANFFDFSHYVDAGGRLFAHCDGPYDSLESAVHEWCRLMHFDQGGRTPLQMVKLINSYRYGDEHWDEVKGYDRFAIFPFVFE